MTCYLLFNFNSLQEVVGDLATDASGGGGGGGGENGVCFARENVLPVESAGKHKIRAKRRKSHVVFDLYLIGLESTPSL